MQPGGAFTYTLDVANNGPDSATLVTVTDTLPSGLTFVSSPDCSAVGQDVTCEIGDLAVNDQVTLTLVVEVGAGVDDDTVLSNTAIVVGDDLDLDPSNNDSMETTTVSVDSADCNVIGESSFTIGGKGKELKWRLTNDGTDTVTIDEITIVWNDMVNDKLV